jgi:DNA helicase-2/ATP-dependent DNA helicase PcrA
MLYTADLHIHSHFSRATSKASTLEGFSQWARIKGIQVLGTGDFTHPGWFQEIRDKLRPAEPGLFVLEAPPGTPQGLEEMLPPELETRFCLSAEISSIYKKDGKTRKVHSLVFAPDLEAASRINARLDMLGNIRSDGRPILGLDPKDLLAIILEISPDAHLIPAHIWTPWFSLLGSKSGFDTVEECFGDLTPQLFAVETGLSSDPSMNWRCGFLDDYALVSHSDAHSPPKLGREADLFNTELSYPSLFRALKTRRGFLGTLEFHPEEGKYHWDGHRKCGICLEPEETIRLDGLCPVCGRPLTVGVLHRVLELADREKGSRPEGSPGFRYLIPLPEILAEIAGTGVQSKVVDGRYREILQDLGSEFSILLEVPVEDIGRAADTLLAEAVRRMRAGETLARPGYDGEFGVIRVFQDGELESLRGQGDLFAPADLPAAATPGGRSSLPAAVGDWKVLQQATPGEPESPKERTGAEVSPSHRPAPAPGHRLSEEQENAVSAASRLVVVDAGPGSGKTRTLIAWIQRLIRDMRAEPEEILAVTFTNKAAAEIRARLRAGTRKAEKVRVSTFHSLCYSLLQERTPQTGGVYDEATRISLLRFLQPELRDSQVRDLAGKIERYMEGSDQEIDERTLDAMASYRDLLDGGGNLDISELVARMNRLLSQDPAYRRALTKRYRFIAVDEFQDINPSQYRLLTALMGEDARESSKRGCVFAIGDPNQAIYGFRGADRTLLSRFAAGAERFGLSRNFRSCHAIVQAGNALLQHEPPDPDSIHQTAAREGGTVLTVSVDEPRDEARFIADQVEQLIGGSSHISVDSLRGRQEGSYSYSDMAVLCRIRAIRNELASELVSRGIPCALSDHSSFTRIPAFRQALHFLRLVSNPTDAAGLAEILTQQLNFPRSSVLKLLEGIKAEGRSATLLAAAERILAVPDAADTSAASLSEPLAVIKELQNALDRLTEIVEQRGVAYALEEAFKRTDQLRDPEQVLQREMLLETGRMFQKDLDGFLQQVALNPFESEGSGGSESLRLLTFHAAKGLEFPVVFIAAAEEGITPLTRRDADLEEEKRLFYVALTRAMDRLTITACRRRRRFGSWQEAQPSRFLSLIPREIASQKEERRIRQLELF